MKNELAVRSWAYDDNLIRTVKLNEEAWFVGKDAAKALGYSNTRDVLANYVDEEDKNTVAINESGLYSLIFSSKLETARQFKRWVTNEVLPAIRKTGSYTKATNEAERAQRYLHQTNANTQGLHMEALFPNVRYAMKEDHGILEQVVYGVRLKTAGKNKSLPDTTLEG